MTVATFGQRLGGAFDTFGQLCVGIDPHDYLLDAWGLPRSADGVREFGLRVVDAAAGVVGIVKPQVAFYELYGSAGFAALEAVLAAARSAGLLVIADAKRGDIGSTIESYGRAWLSPGSPLEADAVTLAAYTGVGSLQPVFDLAEQHGKGAFLLSATSNPESGALQTAIAGRETAQYGGQTAQSGGQTVANLVASEVHRVNAKAAASARSAPEQGSIGNIGVVLGATKDLGDYGIDREALAEGVSTPVLAPGFGFQGAEFSRVHRVFGPLAASTVVSVSRSVLQAGPDGLGRSIRSQRDELAEALANRTTANGGAR